MVVVVHWVPVGPADVAELLAASASHLIATLAPLHYETALLALSVLEVVIQVLYLKVVAVPLVRRKQTLCTVLRLAAVTNHDSIGRKLYDTLA